MTDALTQVLRDEVAAQKTPEPGTVIRFVFLTNSGAQRKRDQGPTHVVAIAGKGIWTLVDEGNAGYVSRTMRHDEFMRLLAGPTVRSSELAVKFEAVTP